VRVTASPGGAGVRLYVIDHGRGIQPRHRELVLRPFHRLSDSTANSGVGLGLAIAGGLTEAMGGRLELQDTPGGGLTVVVSLPTPEPA
jgi:two-component system, OmpR family, sensor histidine kinase KdpD